MKSMDLIAIQIVMLALMASVYKMFNYLLEPRDMDLQAMAARSLFRGLRSLMRSFQLYNHRIQPYRSIASLVIIACLGSVCGIRLVVVFHAYG
jgi:hypothetical protein